VNINNDLSLFRLTWLFY